MRSNRFALPLLLCACGFSAESAREDLTQRGCAYFSRCGEFGAGKTYPSQAECITQLRAYWLNALPTADCSKGIIGTAYDVCTASIGAAQCGNGLDFLSTLSKCGKQTLCAP
jgi:hypothetical protein